MPDNAFEWVGGVSLADVTEEMVEETHSTGERLAYSGIKRFQHNIEINTPVETKKLRNSYKRTPIEYVLALHGITAVYAWEGTVFTEVSYAEYVERGTGLWGPKHAKYKIEPKTPGGTLSFAPYSRGANGSVILDVAGGVTKSGVIHVKYVMHPGSPGAAMFRIGALLTEHQADEWGARVMDRWRIEVESKL